MLVKLQPFGFDYFFFKYIPYFLYIIFFKYIGIETAKTESARTPNLQAFVRNTYGNDTDSFVDELSKMIS